MMNEELLSIAKALSLKIPGPIYDKSFVLIIYQKLLDVHKDAFTAGYTEAIDDAALVARDLFDGLHSPFEYKANVEQAIRRLKKEKP